MPHETTERIVESYYRYVKDCFTLPNIRCLKQYGIDLLAMHISNNGDIERYHVESGISISGSYSKLTSKKFSQDLLRERPKQAGQRGTIGYFIKRKFGPEEVISELKKYGFLDGNYKKVIVTWGWMPEAKADQEIIFLLDFREVLKGIEKLCSRGRTYFTDDTLRTIQLFARGKGMTESGEGIENRES